METSEEEGRAPASFQAPQSHFGMHPKALSPAVLDAAQPLAYWCFQNGRFAERNSSSPAPARSPGALEALGQARGSWKEPALLSALLTQI